MSLTRRALVARSLAGASAVALPGSLVAVAAAQAQDSEDDAQTDALERLLIEEQAAELAFSLAAEDGDVPPEAKSLFEELSIHAGDHATALAEAMDQLLAEPPDAESDQGEYDSLEDFDSEADEKDLVAFLIDLESSLIALYEEEEPELDEPDLVRTAAQVAASHAQALVALRLLAGGKGPLTELPEPSTSATDSSEEDSGSDT